MKKIIILCFSVFSALLIGITTSAQESDVDVITKMNGEQMRGKVLKMGTESLTFVYEGEELQYEVKKSEIQKIVFASGRTQVINEPAAETLDSSVNKPIETTAEERMGKIAVLPFEFTTNNPALKSENLESRAQSDCARSIRENTSGLEVQDPRTTNIILAEHKIAAKELATISPDDLAKLLGVEYVMFGMINVDNSGTHTSGSSVTTYKSKQKGASDDRKTKGTGVSAGNSSTSIEYDVSIELKMYNDQGSNVYSDSREPFSSGIDSYNSSMNYMIKRMPYGKKHKD